MKKKVSNMLEIVDNMVKILHFEIVMLVELG